MIPEKFQHLAEQITAWNLQYIQDPSIAPFYADWLAEIGWTEKEQQLRINIELKKLRQEMEQVLFDRLDGEFLRQYSSLPVPPRPPVKIVPRPGRSTF